MNPIKNILRSDPTRTATLRRSFETEMVRRFARFRRKLVSLVVDEDVFGLKEQNKPWNPVINAKFSSTQLDVTDPECLRLIRELQGRLDPTDVIELEMRPHVTVRYGLHGQDPEVVREIVANMFCKTGEGGGVDPSCGKTVGSKKEQHVEAVKSGVKIAADELGIPDGVVKFSDKLKKASPEHGNRSIKMTVSSDGVITVYPRGIDDVSAIPGILAHEWQHVKTKTAFDDVTRLLPKDQASHPVGRYLEADVLRANEQIFREEGSNVSAYAREHWDKGTVGDYWSIREALDETLSEMSKVRHETGDPPDLPYLNEIYRAVDDYHASKQVRPTTNSFGPVWMTLGRLSLFEQPEHDVLKLDVESQGLERLNTELGKLPNTQTHDNYEPHLTIALLKPGTGWKYLADPSFLEWQSYVFTELTFSDKERNQMEIALNCGGVGGKPGPCPTGDKQPEDHAKDTIAAYRALAPKGQYVSVTELVKHSGQSLVDLQTAIHLLMGSKGKAANWEVYTELSFKKEKTILTPSGKKIALIKLRKIPATTNQQTELSLNVFCPTGEGGGVDPSCSSGKGSGLLQPVTTKGQKLSASRVAELMNKNTEGRIDVQSIKRQLESESAYFVASKVRIADLKGIDNLDVDPKKASPTKGEIIVGRDGSIYDGRHRAALARLQGETTIAAWLPIEIPKRGTTENQAVQNVRWAFRSSPEKIKEFLKWLEGNLQPILTDEATTDDDWWNKYVQAGFKKGAARSYDDMKKAGAIPQSNLPFYLGQKDEFLRSAFRQPESVEKVKMLAGRVYTELKGVTEAMSQNLTRTLTDGLTQGMNPRQIATNIVKVVEGIGIRRARAIAQTEIIRAHAEGQLDSMERLGVKELRVMVEWGTAEDDRVCPLCQPLHGIVITMSEAKGLIPRHVGCRCTWLPANVGEDQAEQVRGASRIKKAITKSLVAGKSKRKSTWAGARRKISKSRPKSIV